MLTLPVAVTLLYVLAYLVALAANAVADVYLSDPGALANCNIDWPTVPKVFSKAVVSKVTWGCCTITGLTGPGGPGGPGGPCLPGCLGFHPFLGGPPSSGGPLSSWGPPPSEGPPSSGGPPLLSGGLPLLSG